MPSTKKPTGGDAAVKSQIAELRGLADFGAEGRSADGANSKYLL
jgi:hypothetical protein